jgi:hypothetical protein
MMVVAELWIYSRYSAQRAHCDVDQYLFIKSGRVATVVLGSLGFDIDKVSRIQRINRNTQNNNRELM